MQKLIAASTVLELEKDISIPLIFKISDIKDISKRSGAFSKTIKLPGTEINNKFFGGIYDLNAGLDFFNPNIKTPCIFSNDGDEFINGFLQLKKVIVDDKKNITYDVVIYDSVLTFWGAMDKKTLSDLDFSDFDHIYSRDNIKATWGSTWDGLGYYYPMLKGSTDTYKTTDFRPFPYLKNVVDRIVTDAGFTWDGNLKTNPIFEKEVFVSDIGIPQISEESAQAKTFRASKSTDELVRTFNTPDVVIPPLDHNYIFDDETTPPNQDLNNLWNIDTFEATDVGLYRFRIEELRTFIEYDYTYDAGEPGGIIGIANPGASLVAVVRDNLAVLQSTEVYPLGFNDLVLPPASGTGTGDGFLYNGNLYFNGLQDLYLGAGWTVEFFYRSEGNTIINSSLQINSPVNERFTVDEVRFTVRDGASIESLFVQYVYNDNVPLAFNDFIDQKFKQKDIIKDLMARYNCLVYVNPENSKEILFNIRDEFYATAPVVNWTNKKDLNTRDQIKLVAELQSEFLKLSYKAGKDPTNELYTDTVGDDNIYGQYEFEFSNEYVKGEKKITSPIIATPLVENLATSAITPAIDPRQPIVGARVLYVGGVLEVGSVLWNWEYKDTLGFDQIAAESGYPYGGHFDNPRTPTIDINFGELPFPQIFYTLNQTTDNNLFNRNWKNTVTQTARGKLVTSKFNLSAADVYFVKNNPNTKVFVESTYFYINSIKFEGNENARKLTSVELLTIEDDQIFDPTNLVVSGRADRGASFVEDEENVKARNAISDPNNTIVVNGSDNVVAELTRVVNITGDNNFVAPESSNVTIVGSNNKVDGSNITLIGVDGQDIKGDNITVINSGGNIVELGSRGVAKDEFTLTENKTIFATSETILNKFAIFEDGILTTKTGTKTGDNEITVSPAIPEGTKVEIIY